MTDYNLTLGQAIDYLLKGQDVICKRFANAFFNMDTINRQIHMYDATNFNVIESPCNIFRLENEKFAFHEPKPEPKLITWYRPKVYFLPRAGRPFEGVDYFKSKDDFFKEYEKGTKVLNDIWETIEAPENFEDW